MMKSGRRWRRSSRRGVVVPDPALMVSGEVASTTSLPRVVIGSPVGLAITVACMVGSATATGATEPVELQGTTTAVQMRIRSASEEVRPIVVGESVSTRFRELSARWHRDTDHWSVLARKFKHPAYEGILRMGPVVVPCILREIEARPGHWHTALRQLTGANPVPPGTPTTEACRVWLAWARSNGYRW